MRRRDSDQHVESKNINLLRKRQMNQYEKGLARYLGSLSGFPSGGTSTISGLTYQLGSPCSSSSMTHMLQPLPNHRSLFSCISSNSKSSHLGALNVSSACMTLPGQRAEILSPYPPPILYHDLQS